jgi:ribosomal protein S18 acetylase RimI-like enzyme
MAALACPPDPEGVAWIRLFATVPNLSVMDAWESLWKRTCSHFAHNHMIVAAIPVEEWFGEILFEEQFQHKTDVILLEWLPTNLTAPLPNPAFRIRKMRYQDVIGVQRVDETAFDTIWRNSKYLLEIAHSKSVYATVAESHEGIIGYQISTASSKGGHLARLAVLPEWQGMGVGYKLVYKMLGQFNLWGTKKVTVNTQTDNVPSLALYEKTGFRPTDEIFPVFQKKLNYR